MEKKSYYYAGIILLMTLTVFFVHFQSGDAAAYLEATLSFTLLPVLLIWSAIRLVLDIRAKKTMLVAAIPLLQIVAAAIPYTGLADIRDPGINLILILQGIIAFLTIWMVWDSE